MLLPQELDFEVKNRKSTKSQVVDHLSHLEDEVMLKIGDDLELDLDDIFPEEDALEASQDLIPWFVDFTNYLENDLVPGEMLFQQ